MADVQVKTKLTLDDQASSALNRVRDGFSSTQHAASAAQQGLGFFKQTFSTMLGMNLMPIIGQVRQFAASFLHAAEADEMVTRQMAALASAMEGLPWDQAMAKGQGLNDFLDDLAIKSGQSGDALTYAFERLVEIGGSTDKARGSLEALSKVSEVMGKDVGAIAQEYAFMGEGMIKVRGPLFNLLKNTGAFGNNVKDIRSNWEKLTEEQRVKILETGLGRLSKSLSSAPPSLAKMIGSMREMWGVLKEVIGAPILKAVMPGIEGLQKGFLENRKEFEKLAESLGTEVGMWVGDAAKHIEEGFKYIKTHKDEIKTAIIDALKKAKELIEFILKHKEEIAIAFGAKVGGSKMADFLKPAAGLVGGVYKAGAGAGGAAAGETGAVGGVTAVAALAVAVFSLGMAAEQTTKLMGEWKSGFWDAMAQTLAGEKATDRAADATARMKAAEEALARGRLDVLEQLASRQRDGTQEGYKYAEMILQQKQAFEKSNADLMAMVKPFELVQAGAKPVSVGPLVEAYNIAAQQGNKGMMSYIANIFAGSNVLSVMLKQSGETLVGGLHEMGSNVSLNADAVAKSWKELMASPLEMKKSVDEALKKKPAGPNINIGNATFNMKQEFRDQDPDRVAVVFQRDIARAAINRVMSNRATVFGV